MSIQEMLHLGSWVIVLMGIGTSILAALVVYILALSVLQRAILETKKTYRFTYQWFVFLRVNRRLKRKGKI